VAVDGRVLKQDRESAALARPRGCEVDGRGACGVAGEKVSLLDQESDAEHSLEAPHRLVAALLASLGSASAFSVPNRHVARATDHPSATVVGRHLRSCADEACVRRGLVKMAAEDPDVFDSLFDTSGRMSRLDALIADAKGGLPSETPSEASAASAGPASGPASLPALGPSAERVEIRATGKNLDLSPGCWVQKVLRDAPDFMLEQRGDATFFRTSDGVRETEVTFWSIDEAIEGPGESKGKNVFEFSKDNFFFEDVEYLMRKNSADSSSEVDTIFQAASQFNALEMASSRFTPRRGVEIYSNDNTQGPAVAMAGGYATIYRNYGMDVSVHDRPNTVSGINTDGQLTEQYNALQHVIDDEAKKKMENGYFLPTRDWLAEQQGIPRESHPLRKLQVGVHPTVELTDKLWAGDDEPRKYVGQVYASAFPIKYSGHGKAWGDLVATELTQEYLLTFLAALKTPKFVTDGAPVRVYLTLLGGGAFGNPTETIIESIFEAAKLFEQRNDGLHIKVYINLSRRKELQADVLSAAASAGYIAEE
jgi:hypothetical protein